MFLAVKSRPINEFNSRIIDLLVNRIDLIATKLTTMFGVAIWDYSYASNELVQMLGVHPLEDGSYLTELERVFPALSCKAKRLFEQSMRNERVGISPIDLTDDRSFMVVVTPDNLMLFGVKSDSLKANHTIIRKLIKEVTDVRDSIKTDSLWRETTKIVNFKPTELSSNYSVAAL